MKHALIIEKDKQTREVLYEIFKEEGWAVSFAPTMAMARVLLEYNFDVVLADHWTVRAEDGFSTLSKIQTPIFVLSSCQNATEDFQWVSYRKILPKPCSLAALLECIQTLQ